MGNRRKYSRPKRPAEDHRGRKAAPPRKPPRFRPGADTRLKKVFTRIGVPKRRPFAPDPYQQEAVEIIAEADCLVTAPTGSGKTWIALQAISRTRAQGGRAWYASPLKALSNAKHAEFSEHFGADQVGILTGDRKENPEAPIIVGTTEILRNHLYDAMHQGEDLGTDLVVLDEAHFLGDPERGVVWEEIMIYLPARIPLLLLSATIGNAPQIADWLGRIRKRECRVVAEFRRPVPLYPIFFHPSGTLMPLLAARRPGKKPRLYKKVQETVQSRRPQNLAPPGKLPNFGEMLKVLKRFALLPAIFFLKSRADCDSALELCLSNRTEDEERDQQRRARIDTLLARSPHIAHHRQRRHLENLAVGSHHAGQLPAWKLVLEDLMTRGMLDAVFATSTVAAGVNFPARSVVLFNSDRFNGTDFVALTPTEFHQMTGRAGRRGMDNIGFCILAPGKFMDLRLIARLLDAQPSDVDSQIKINFSMVLNLLLSHRPAQVEDLLERSFANYLQSRHRAGRRRHPAAGSDARHLWEDFLHHLEFLQRYDYVAADGALTEDGYWASRLRVDQPLLIAEGFRRAAFPEDDPALMAAIVASFVHERETDDRINRDYLPKELMGAFLKLRGALAPFAKDMLNEGFHARPLYLKPAAAVYAWVNGGSWETAQTVAEMEEGILATLLLRTVDNLRHIRALAEIFPTAARTAGEAIERIMRDPVSLFY